MADYGVTSALVQAEVGQGATAFAAATVPTSTQVETWIAESGAMWSATIRSLGLDPDTIDADTASEGYAIAKRIVTLDVAVRVVRAQGRRPELVTQLREERDRLYDRFVAAPSRFGDSQPTTDASHNLTRSEMSSTTSATRAGYRQSVFDDPNRRL